LSPFSATIVQNTGDPRNDWNFTTIPCGVVAIPALGSTVRRAGKSAFEWLAGPLRNTRE
jgi:hypothetical protein